MTTRTFAKKCIQCRQRTMALTPVPYSVQIDHDGRKYSVNIPDLVVPKCSNSNCGAVSLDEEATRRIDEEFRRVAGLLTPEAIKKGRQQLGMSQQELADAIGIAPSTLSRWETGAQVQQRSMNNLLRAFFDLPAFRDYLERQPTPEHQKPQLATDRVK